MLWYDVLLAIKINNNISKLNLNNFDSPGYVLTNIGGNIESDEKVFQGLTAKEVRCLFEAV